MMLNERIPPGSKNDLRGRQMGSIPLTQKTKIKQLIYFDKPTDHFDKPSCHHISVGGLQTLPE